MRLSILLLLFSSNILASVMLFPANTQKVITFQEALKLAKINNWDLKKSVQHTLIKHSDFLLTQSALFPKLSFNLSNAFGYQEQTFDTSSMGLNLHVPFFDGKKLFETKASCEQSQAAKERDFYEVESLVNKVGGLYIEALGLSAQKNIAKEAWEQNQQQLSVLEKKLKVGRARNLDILRSQYLSSKAHSDYLQKEQEFLQKLGELGQAIGVNEQFGVDMLDIDSAHLKKEQSLLIAMADDSQEAKALKRELVAVRYSLVGEALDFLPKVSMSADYGFRDQTMFIRDKAGLRVMFNLELPLFSGGSSIASLKNKHAQKAIAEIAIQQKANERTLSINAILKDIDNQNLIKISTEQALEAALEAKNSAERMFKEGEATSLEMSEANANLANAKSHAIRTKLKLEQLKLQLLFIIGKASELL